MTENPNNGLRKSSGLITWAKGDKPEKNKKITPHLKESHSIPNFQTHF